MLSCFSSQRRAHRTQIGERLGCSKTAMYQAIVKFKELGTYADAKRGGRSRETTLITDILIKKVMNSPTCSAKKIRADLNETGISVSRQTIIHSLVEELGLKSRKLIRKPRLTLKMKKKRVEFALQHKNWTCAQWSKALFQTNLQFNSLLQKQRNVRRPPGTRYNKKYTQETIKHPPNVMVGGAISIEGTAGLFFLKPGTTINGQRYLNLMKEKLQLHMSVHDCIIFMQDGAPCYCSKIVTDFLPVNKITLLEWPGNSFNLNFTKTYGMFLRLYLIIKLRFLRLNPSNIPALTKAIKLVWIREIPEEFYKNLIESMLRRMKAVIKAKRGLTKY